ncbi:MAG: ATP-binding protein [Clostridia bacterium]|nr:ATP-binding protein [Clostridia bacterium]
MKQDLETYYADLRRNAVRQLEARRKACEAMDPGFAALQAKRGRVFSLPAQGARMTLATIRLEEEALLKRHDLPKDYLQPVYACPLCKDTGYVGDPVKKKCACRLKLEQREMVENARINERETFESFRESIYPDDASRQSALKIMAYCQRYADTLPTPNIRQLYLYGEAGRGKSFMGNAIAARAIERGVESLRLTAYRMNEEVMRGFSTNVSPLPRFTQVPLLVLDDLGTEAMIPNVTAETLFAIADQRNMSRLATVYISNLNAAELAEHYGERTASRILDAAITRSIVFDGASLRTKKEERR